nr:MAG TPA: hypothetical protein [Bacteriophage sp.]
MLSYDKFPPVFQITFHIHVVWVVCRNPGKIMHRKQSILLEKTFIPSYNRISIH